MKTLRNLFKITFIIFILAGRNEIIVLDLEEGGLRSVQGIKELVFETPKTE